MNSQYSFSAFSRQSPKGIIVNYFILLYKILKASWALVILLFTKDDINYNTVFLGVGLALIVILVIATLQYLFFKFKIEDQHFMLKKGVISKSDTTIPFERIQNVSFKQNLVQQIINVTQVEVETAGAKSVEISIKALAKEKAEALKAAIMQHVDTNVETDAASEAKEEEIYLLKLSFFELFKVSITENHLRSLAIIVSLLFSLNYQFEELSKQLKVGEKLENLVVDNADAILSSVFLIVVLVIFLLVIAMIASLVRTILVHFNLKVLIKDKALEISQGLLTIRNFTLKKEKVQYIKVTTNPLKKLLGIHGILFKQASASKGKTKSKKQIKIVGAQVNHIDKLNKILFTKAEFDEMEKHYPDQFYIVLMALRSFIFIVLLNTIVYLAMSGDRLWLLNSLLVPLTILLIWLKYKKSYFKVDNDLLIKGHGQIETNQTYFEYYRIQSIQMQQSVFQKRRGVVNLVLQTSSGKVRIPFVDRKKALVLYNYMLYKSETSEKEWM